jgi:Arc/MetJ-type ribon-helix-helix transcriptional regulator
LGNKQKKIRLPDDDFALIEEMKRQFKKQGFNASDSDVISAALRALKEKGKVVIDLDADEKPRKRKETA